MRHRHHLIPALMAAQSLAGPLRIERYCLSSVEFWGPVRCWHLPDGNRDGILDIRDYACFLNAYTGQSGWADCDGNGAWTAQDFACFANAFAARCRPAVMVLEGTVTGESWTGYGLPALDNRVTPGPSPMAYWANIIPEPVPGAPYGRVVVLDTTVPLHMTVTRFVPTRARPGGGADWHIVREHVEAE